MGNFFIEIFDVIINTINTTLEAVAYITEMFYTYLKNKHKKVFKLLRFISGIWCIHIAATESAVSGMRVIYTGIIIYALCWAVCLFVEIGIYCGTVYKNTNGLPVPVRRFTMPSADDEIIEIDSSRMQELVIYMYELENVLHERGLL